ncbi:MAG TPA: 5'-3' exonuclease H3TH domain-containing protein, partial [Oligoflexia bacterium]|nr:5'-3' exonuclease H3TH domain-containing protein [Oligoflexia bacterium]
MDPLYLVDGSGYIFRAYYAVQPLSTSTGLPTNAVMGFTRMLTKLLRDVQAKYIAVAFDVSRETFRTALYPQYKANRKECPEDLVPQMPYFRKIVEAFGIRSLEKSGAEADDVIATITKCFVGKGQKIVIVSGDKDLTQLVDGDVQVWDAMRDIMFDRGKVREKFGVWPEQMVDYLALVGDASDNVPGVKGIGPKTAERLLDHFGSIEEMLKKSNEIGGLGGLRGANSIQQKIESAPEALRLSLELVRLKTDVEPFNQVAEISEFGWHQAKPDLIRPLFDELEFHSMRDVADFLEVGGAAGVARLPGRTNKREFTVVSPERLAAFAADLSACKEFAFDTETTSLDFMSCALLGISIFWGGSHAYYLPLGGEVETERHLDNELVLRLLKPIFADPQIRKIGFNLKFDLEVLAGQGIEVNGAVFDGMLCSHLLNPDRRVHGLKQLARTYLDEAMLTYEDALGGAE